MSHERSFRGRIGFAASEDNIPDRTLGGRWGSHQLFEEGFVGVPTAFLRCYTKLNVSNGEAMFVLQLMSFKWTDKAPFPSYKTLAQRMGITTEMARRHAKSLEEKRLLVRVKRTGQSNAFDLGPLATALERLIADNPRTTRAAA